MESDNRNGLHLVELLMNNRLVTVPHQSIYQPKMINDWLIHTN